MIDEVNVVPRSRAISEADLQTRVVVDERARAQHFFEEKMEVLRVHL